MLYLFEFENMCRILSQFTWCFCTNIKYVINKYTRLLWFHFQAYSSTQD